MDEIRARISTISDPRHASYIKHQLSDILLIIMCGVLSGLDTLGDLALYANEKQDFFQSSLWHCSDYVESDLWPDSEHAGWKGRR